MNSTLHIIVNSYKHGTVNIKQQMFMMFMLCLDYDTKTGWFR